MSHWAWLYYFSVTPLSRAEQPRSEGALVLNHSLRHSRTIIGIRNMMSQPKKKRRKPTKIIIEMFPGKGMVDDILNQFAVFIFNRKSLSEATERRFVAKLDKMHSIKSGLDLLQDRISKGEVRTRDNTIGVLAEMKDAFQRHSTILRERDSRRRW